MERRVVPVMLVDGPLERRHACEICGREYACKKCTPRKLSTACLVEFRCPNCPKPERSSLSVRERKALEEL